jgi:hypothetical protein
MKRPGSRSAFGSAALLSLILAVTPAFPQTPDQVRRMAVEDEFKTKGDYTLRFDYDQSDILPEAKTALEDIAAVLKSSPSLRLLIVGHTDNIGSSDFNARLSLERANAVRSDLIKRGVPGDRLVTEGAGEERPVASNDTEEGRSLNRRVQLVRIGVDETAARDMLRRMSEYLARQKVIAFDYDSTLEVVTHAHQKLAVASSGSVLLNRPDKLRVTRKGGFADTELVFDGATATLIGKNANVYAQASVPGSVDHLVNEFRETFRLPVPGADLLASDIHAQLSPDIIGAQDLGSGVVRGRECDHLAFRTTEADWQIWMTQGDNPVPCRLTVTSTHLEGWPEYSVDITNVRTGADVPSDDFVAQVPGGARKIEHDDALLGELPPNFTIKKGS